MKSKINILVQGQLDKKWMDWFDGMDISSNGDTTELSGFVKDESFMYGIINKLRDLNLKLISVSTINNELENK